jgi:hypothetical protein
MDEILAWIRAEVTYGFDKIADLHADLDNDALDVGLDSGWVDHFSKMYLHRARVLGIDTPGGRQALAKAAAGLVGVLCVYVKAYGMPPPPGVPSGDLGPF